MCCVCMERVQMLLESETHLKVRTLAKAKKMSVSQFVRKAVEIDIDATGNPYKNAVQVLRNAASRPFSGGPKDLSINDTYLYKIND